MGELLAQCRLKSTCGRADGCNHGKPHVPDFHCADGEICYDHIPAERAWCEILPPKVEAS